MICPVSEARGRSWKHLKDTSHMRDLTRPGSLEDAVAYTKIALHPCIQGRGAVLDVEAVRLAWYQLHPMQEARSPHLATTQLITEHAISSSMQPDVSTRQLLCCPPLPLPCALSRRCALLPPRAAARHVIHKHHHDGDAVDPVLLQEGPVVGRRRRLALCLCRLCSWLS